MLVLVKFSAVPTGDVQFETVDMPLLQAPVPIEPIPELKAIQSDEEEPCLSVSSIIEEPF